MNTLSFSSRLFRAFQPLALLRATLLALLTTLASTSIAGEGHDHGEAPATSSGPAAPRFVAHSDLFEAVGVLGDSELAILIDRYDSNEPVLQAKVEMESGSFKALAPFHAEHGDYSVPAKTFQKPGTYPITLTITAGDQTDLLAGELVVPDPEGAHANEAHASGWPKWLGWLAWAAAWSAIAVLALWGWRQFRSRQSGVARI